MFYLSAEDIADCTGRHLDTVRNAVSYHKQGPLPRVVGDPDGKGKTQHYRVVDTIPRLRSMAKSLRPTTEELARLFALDRKRRVAANDASLWVGDDAKARAEAVIACLKPEELERFEEAQRQRPCVARLGR